MEPSGTTEAGSGTGGGLLWRARGRRLAVGVNVLAAVLLAGLLVLMVNYLAARYPLRWNWSWSRYYTLSQKTLAMLGSLETQIHVVALFRPGHPLYRDVRHLLREYEYAAAGFPNLRLTIEVLDPDRDLARIRSLKREYDMSDVNVVIFSCGGRTKYVEAKELADYDRIPMLQGKPQKMTGFRGEQAFSSAILSVAESAKPVVYFLCGHGERDTLDFGRSSGYSTLARLIRRDNVEVRRLQLSSQATIPADGSALVIAGPDRRFSAVEVDVLRRYLNVGGRLFLLLDPAIVTGLEPLLGEWGVVLSQDVVAGLTLTGRELIVTEYGDHPVTKRLRNVTTSFFMPRSVIPADPAAAGAADRPHASILATCGKGGWQEFDLDQNPPTFNKGVDKMWDVPIAVAVEKGVTGGLDMNLKPTRIVVVGDSYFVSNGGLAGAVGGNRDFFMSGLNWLLEREALMTIQPKPPEELHLDMSRRQVVHAFLVFGLGIPGIVALLGMAVGWWRSR